MYKGPAVIETPARIVDVRVDLWARPPRGIMLGEWGGSVVADASLRDIDEASIVLPDDRRGTVRVSNADAEGRATLRGTGSPPS